jgi:hypothetical protein
MKGMKARRVLGVQEVPGSNPGSPTKTLKDLQSVDPEMGSVGAVFSRCALLETTTNFSPIFPI